MSTRKQTHHSHIWSGRQAIKSRPIQKMNGQLYKDDTNSSRRLTAFYKKKHVKKMRHHVKMLSQQEYNDYFEELSVLNN